MARPLSPSILAWLRCFEAVARHSSFTRAAGELGLTQGAVSQQVRHLEEAVGVPLLLREPQGLSLTPQGRGLAAVAERALASLRDALSEIREPGGLVPVTLSCSPSFAMRWLGPRLGRLPPQLSGIDLRVFGEFHGLDRARMTSEGIEAAVRYDVESYPGLSVTTFLDEHLVAVASPAFVETHPAVAAASDLDGRLLLHDARAWQGAAEDEEWRRYLNATGERSPDLTAGKKFNMSQLAIAAAVAGEGVAMGRLALVLDDLAAGRLVALFGQTVPSGATYKFIAKPDRPPRIAAIGRWLKAEATAFAATRDAFLARLAAGSASPGRNG